MIYLGQDPVGISAGGLVNDVQVNGESVVQNGVANIPKGSASNHGVFKIDTRFGIRVLDNSSYDGLLAINKASNTTIKEGANENMPITPSGQHYAAFYGLAKVAGVNMASSSNAVGTYTEEAKIAIQKMLGIYQAPWELIREDTFTNETEADHVITVDGNGETFKLTDIVMLFELPKQNNEAKKGLYGQIWYFYKDSANYLAPEPGGWTQAANADPRGFKNFIESNGNLVTYSDSAQTTTTNSGSRRYRYIAGFSGAAESVKIINNFYVNSITIKAVTGTGHYKLYGKRKWQ